MMSGQLGLFQQPPPSADAPRRHVQLGSRIVAYALRRAARRRLSLTIDERGLRVSAPLQISLKEIERFISNNAAWVLNKLDEYARMPIRRPLVMDGCRLPLLGGEIEIRVLPGGNRVRWEGDTLVLEARPRADLQSLARKGLRRRAMDVFSARLARYAGLLRLPVPPLALSSARTRWGSCSKGSGIRLNWRLIHLPIELVDYVVAHELAHLTEMNHNARFWAVVGSIYPAWREARRELKNKTSAIPLL